MATQPEPADRRPALLVSACLLGVRCNHEGASAKRNLRADLEERYRLIPVCPEAAGGLTTPRPAAEIQTDGRVVNVDGVDVTREYERGADLAVRLAGAAGAERAVLKARSPSCGTGRVYDGSFSGTLVEGDGVTAAALREAGLVVGSEDDPLP